jgi:hypothetical protein
VAEENSQPTCVELDCLTLIKAIEERKESRASWAGIIEEIRGVSSLLPGCKFQHVRREANKAAHSLAQRALRTQECGVLSLSAPEEILSIIEAGAAGNCSVTNPCNPIMII